MSYEQFNPDDLLITAYPESYQGFGPHRIPNGIRVIHLPTGTVVSCNEDRSQHKNRHTALTRLWEQVQGKPSYAELAAQVEVVRHAWESVKSTDYDKILDEALELTPAACLAQVRAEAAQEYYYMGWEHSLSTKAEDGDHYACGRRLAKQFADAIRLEVK